MIERCLAGEDLWGDSLPPADVERWFESERSGYRRIREARESAGEVDAAGTHYDAVNRLHGFAHLPAGQLGCALALGGYDGSDLRPIWNRLSELDVLDPAFGDRNEVIDGLPVRHTVPRADGAMPFADGAFDLATAFGVLHHVPTVTQVLCELTRVLRIGGHLLIREPCVSMGDWRTRYAPRLTPNERGLPLPWLRQRLAELPLEIVAWTPWNFPPVPRLSHRFGVRVPFDSSLLTRLDSALCRAFSWNEHYHRTSLWRKFGPAAVYIVARRTAP